MNYSLYLNTTSDYIEIGIIVNHQTFKDFKVIATHQDMVEKIMNCLDTLLKQNQLSKNDIDSFY